MAKKSLKDIELIIIEDGRYPPEAVQFVREGLHHTMEKHCPEGGQSGQRRHVTGAQLCQGLRELALKRWGMLAPTVLKRWNITKTRDFGEIVFLLINNGWMQKEPTDNIEDFESVYDFADAFDSDF